MKFSTILFASCIILNVVVGYHIVRNAAPEVMGLWILATGLFILNVLTRAWENKL